MADKNIAPCGCFVYVPDSPRHDATVPVPCTKLDAMVNQILYASRRGRTIPDPLADSYNQHISDAIRDVTGSRPGWDRRGDDGEAK